MSFNPLRTFKQHRIARAGVALVVLAGAAFAEYKLANVPQPVDLKTTGQFSPATIKLGQAELIIKGPEVTSKERVLFSHNGKPKETLDTSFDNARLDDDTREMFESFGERLPSPPTRIAYQAKKSEESSASGKPCSTRVEISAPLKMPDEIHIFQLEVPGVNLNRYLEMKTKGGELVLNLLTRSSDNSALGPGCQYEIKVGDWSEPITETAVAIVNAEASDLRLRFKPLTLNSSPWAETDGFLLVDLGVPQVKPKDLPPFRASAVSIESLDTDHPHTFLSADSTKPGELLTIKDLKIGSDQIQVNIDGTGWVKIGEKPWTVNFMKRLEENKILGAILTAANFALLGWLSRLVLKAPSKPAPTQAP